MRAMKDTFTPFICILVGFAAVAAAAPKVRPNQPAAPAGFDVARTGVAKGTITAVEYPSKTGSGTFHATVYTPPGYSSARKYPVLYLLHGASGDEKTWVQSVRADAILDNLYAEKKLVPMIVVMPSCLPADAREQAGDSREAKARAGRAFSEVLLRDLIPFVEAKYPALSGREHRALAGLSMGEIGRAHV